LRKLAAQKLAREIPGQTLQPTALVHEAYLQLVGQEPPRSYKCRGHFVAAAAAAMHHLLVDRARRKQSRKYGGGWQRKKLSNVAGPEPDAEQCALDGALHKLAATDAVKAKLVELRCP